MQSNEKVDKKRIAKNTLLLYVRMFVSMAVSLYTSRIVLNVLGVTDYGIYNLVGGIISVVAFLNSSMLSATQRFISYELGKGDAKKLNIIFCTSINIYVIICLIGILVGETIGLWFVNTQLVIPGERLVAANWVYQASILSLVVNFMSVPYNSLIIAHEKMSAFAYISIFEVLLKLAIALILLVITYDKLIVYSILVLVAGIIIRLCYSVYCKLHFEESRYSLFYDKTVFKELFAFAGWSVFGNMGFSFKDQISSIILNIFCGPELNAARGIGIQVNAMVSTFVNNFGMALNPQITKQYAAGNIEESRKLVFIGNRMSFFLLLLISLPIIINVDLVLNLWLGVVPSYSKAFVTISLIISMLYSISGCETTAIQATGRMKWFQIGIFIIMMGELPIAWIFLDMGFPPYSVMWPTLLSYTIAIIFRYWLLTIYVKGYSFKDYFIKVLYPCSLVSFFSYFICNFLKASSGSVIMLFISVILCLIVTTVIIFFLGINSNERALINLFISKHISRFK